MKKFFFLLAVTAMIASGFFGKSLMNVMAKEQETPNYKKYYTSIEIRPGDSLWTIAKEFRRHSGKSTEEYVKELKSMNKLGEDIIHVGNYLTVAYYVEEADYAEAR